MKAVSVAPPPASVVAATVATVGLGVVGWAVTIPRMSRMDMGVASTLGSFPFFLSVWVPMMLPGVAPSVLRLAGSGRAALDIPRYIGSYLSVWALFGVLVFALYRPHGTATAGAITIAAGAYELTPMKRRFRDMCRDRPSSGLSLGLCCVGSSVGLMLMMVAYGVMSLVWMAGIAGVVLLQKLVPPRTLYDVPVALAIIGLGIAEFVK